MQQLPPDHPLFRAQFEIKQVPQIPSINFWLGSGGETSERYTDSDVPTARGISDAGGRLIVLMTHNTDLGDSWEREADDPVLSDPGRRGARARRNARRRAHSR